MKGYKAFNADLSCSPISSVVFKYAIGQEYVEDGPPAIREKGFHFYKDLDDAYGCYPTSIWTRICEIEALGDICEEGTTTICVTNRIKIVRELSPDEIVQRLLENGLFGYLDVADLLEPSIDTLPPEKYLDLPQEFLDNRRQAFKAAFDKAHKDPRYLEWEHHEP